MTVLVRDPDLTIHVGDALDVLRTLDAGSVQCCVTSPPYFGLRDYGHPEQVGLEATLAEYVDALVAVFAEVHRVLAGDGTLWLNLGDSYSHGGNGSRDAERWPKQSRNDHRVQHPNRDGKPKDLLGVPWRVAFALQASGWYLRSDIVWAKPNPMPESVTDRPTKAHEYVFLLSKSPRYFYDAAAISEPAAWERWGDQTVGAGSNPNGWIKPKGKNELARSVPQRDRRVQGFNERWDASEANGTAPKTRNARSVWSIPTQPYPDAHFAVFPEELPRRCILAGSAPGHTILDPFSGSGTTGTVARKHGRRALLIELNPEYARMAAERCSQLSLLAAEGAV